MTSYSTVIRIGNSNGIIIPAKMLKSLSIGERDSIVLSESQGGILIKKLEDKIDDTPFSVLDRWNIEHGYESNGLESLDYVEQIRGMRNNKDSKSW